MESHAFAVQPDSVSLIWKHVESFLGEAVKYSDGRHDINLVRSTTSSGVAQLWAMISRDGEAVRIIGAAVTEVRNYPGKPRLAVLLCGGIEMNLWLADLIERFKLFAQFHDLDGIEFVGRPGWEKVLTEYGFKKRKCVLMELPLDGGR